VSVPGRRVAVAALWAAIVFAFVPAPAAAQAAPFDVAQGAPSVSRGAATTRVPALEQSSKQLAAALLVLEQSPSAAAHERVAALYVQRGVLDSAFKHFESAVRLDRRRSAAHEGLARIWRTWGFADRALTEAHTALFYAPRSPGAHNTLGTTLMALGDSAGARAEFTRAIELDPSAAYAYSNLGYLALKQREMHAAIAWCEKALTLDPTLAEAANNLGLAYAFTGDYAKAHAAFAKVGTPSEAAYNLGLTYLSANRLDDAALALTAAATGAPWSTQIVDRLRQVNRLRAERLQ
jgi:tetratricopeptide (TPR) repeat protein